MLCQSLTQETDRALRYYSATELAVLAIELDPSQAAALLNKALALKQDSNSRQVLVASLAVVAQRMAPGDAARVCREPARLLHRELSQKIDRHSLEMLAEDLAALARHLEPTEAAQICAEPAGLLSQALLREQEDRVAQRLAEYLTALAGHLEPGAAARLLGQTLEKKEGGESRKTLAIGLAVVAGRLEPAEAARVCAKPARLLCQALVRKPYSSDQGALAEALVAVAPQLNPVEATQICAETARLLHQALVQEKDGTTRGNLAEGLGVLAGCLDSAEAGRVSGEAARLVCQALGEEKDIFARQWLVRGLGALAGRLKPSEIERMFPEAARSEILDEDTRVDYELHLDNLAHLLEPVDNVGANGAARNYARKIVCDPDYTAVRPGNGHDRRYTILRRFLQNCASTQLRRRASAVAVTVGFAVPGLLPSFPLQSIAAEPFPCRLSTQDLVDLLKMPTCVREVRRVILDQLGNRYRRRFDTHWDFVRYAEEQKLGLDFTTPPKRPERKLPPLFVE